MSLICLKHLVLFFKLNVYSPFWSFDNDLSRKSFTNFLSLSAVTAVNNENICRMSVMCQYIWHDLSCADSNSITNDFCRFLKRIAISKIWISFSSSISPSITKWKQNAFECLKMRSRVKVEIFARTEGTEGQSTTLKIWWCVSKFKVLSSKDENFSSKSFVRSTSPIDTSCINLAPSSCPSSMLPEELSSPRYMKLIVVKIHTLLLKYLIHSKILTSNCIHFIFLTNYKTFEKNCMKRNFSNY